MRRPHFGQRGFLDINTSSNCSAGTRNGAPLRQRKLSRTGFLLRKHARTLLPPKKGTCARPAVKRRAGTSQRQQTDTVSYQWLTTLRRTYSRKCGEPAGSACPFLPDTCSPIAGTQKCGPPLLQGGSESKVRTAYDAFQRSCGYTPCSLRMGNENVPGPSAASCRRTGRGLGDEKKGGCEAGDYRRFSLAASSCRWRVTLLPAPFARRAAFSSNLRAAADISPLPFWLETATATCGRLIPIFRRAFALAIAQLSQNKF